MTPREITTELQRLRRLVESLAEALDAFEARVVGGSGETTLPPPARPTARVRRVSHAAIPRAPAHQDGPTTKRTAGAGTYRHVSPKKP